MDRRDWVVYPWQVDAKVVEWQERFPQYIDVEFVEQYTRHKVFALTVTDKSVPANAKRKHLFFVPHAGEPAGTAGCMNSISQLVTGKHLDGCPSTLFRERILREALLTFIPDANPYGRARCPVPYWDGDKYANSEFSNMVFGIGDLHPQDPRISHWVGLKRVNSFSVRGEAPARIGLIYEQVDEYEYVETQPARADERASLVKLLRRALEKNPYDQVLELHQAELEEYVGGENCMLILPMLQDELAQERQAYNLQWAERIHTGWRAVGGVPTPLQSWPGNRSELHPRSARDRASIKAELERQSPLLSVEIQNNSPNTPHEKQLLLMDVAIWRSVEFLLTAR